MTDLIGRGVLELVGDSSQLEATMAKAEQAVRRFETAGTQAAGRTTEALAGIGVGTGQGLAEMDAKTRKAAESLQLLTARAELSPAAFQLFRAQLKGLDTDALTPFAQRLQQAIDKQSALQSVGAKTANTFGLIGVSAGQATAAMRTLPAQITDIVTSLQGGQAPLTVLLQQGGQLRDVFGSVGNVFRGLASLITPGVVAIGGAAAAAGALALAYKLGSAEADSFRRALVLTGNAAGASVDQLSTAAEAVARAVGTQAKAAEVIAQLAATGRVAGGDLTRLTEAAIRLEREGGPAVEETVKAFAELGKDPVKASAKLNESTNFLTLAVYRQIKALEDQGRVAEAAALAQSTFADTAIARAKTLEGSLGTLESAWRTLGDAAKGAWDFMLGIGRRETPQQQIDRLQAGIESLAHEMGGAGVSPARFADLDAARQKLIDTQSVLQSDILLTKRSAEAQGELATAVRSGIKAEDARASALKKTADEFRRLAEAGAGFVRALDAEASGVNADYLSRLKEVEAARNAGLITTDQQIAAIEALIQKQPFYVAALKAESDARKALADVMGVEMKARAQYLDSLDKGIAAQQRELQSIEDQLYAARFGKEALEERVLLRKQEEVALLDLEAARALLERSDGAEYERLRLRADLLQSDIDKRRELAGVISGNEMAKATADANAKAAAEAAREWERTAADIRTSLTDAFRRAFESGEDFGSAFAKAIERELKARLAAALSGLLADGVLQLAGLAASGQGGGQGMTALSTANSLATLYSSGAKAYSWATGGTAATGMTADFVAGYKGATLAAGQAGPTTAGATGAMGAGSSAGSSTAWLSTWGAAIALGVYKANRDYSEGFRRDGAREVGRETFGLVGTLESTMADILSKLGFSDRLADLLSGATAVSKIFGRADPRVEGTGVQGFLGSGDFAGQSYVDIIEKGGLLRSDKRYQQLGEAPEEIGRLLDSSAAEVLKKAKDYGTALGLPVAALGSVTTDIKVALTDDAEANVKAIAEALGGYGDALVAGFADAVAPLAQYGETTAETLERVGGAMVGVNQVLDTLGLTALQASVDGGKAALSLQDLFGGLAPLQQAAGGYLQNFYSDAERADLTLRSIGDALGDVGLAVPASRDAFRGLVDDIVNSGGLLTEAGRDQFAALMGVADAFAAVTQPAEDLAAAADDTARAAAEAAQAIADLQRSIRDGLSQVIGDFVAPGAVAPFRASEVQSALAGGGITASVEQILGSTRGDIVALWNAVGDEGKAAILEAYDAWQAMHDAILAADIAGIVEPLGTSADELLGAYAELTPAADNLVGAWRDTRTQVDELAAALASIDGTAAVSAIDSLRATIAQRDGLAGVISGNADRAFDLRVGQGGQRAVDMLRQREATLWAEFASTNNPAVAQAITQATLQRIALEGELQGDANAAQLDALEQQISAAERLRDLAAEMGGFILSLQAGDLSNLGYAGRLAASESIFSASLTSGQDVQSSATSLLQNAQSMFGGATGAYSDVFESVTGRLRGIGAADYTGTISDAQAQLDALAGIDATAEAQIAALGELNTRFGTGLDSLNLQVEAQTAAVREQVAELRALQANQERQILQFGLALTRLIEASERTAEAVESTADAVELEGAAP